MNKAELLAVLARLDIKPSRRLGQNFLLDPNLLDAMVRLSGACAGQRVLEIGPGTGALTERLLASGRAGSSSGWLSARAVCRPGEFPSGRGGCVPH